MLAPADKERWEAKHGEALKKEQELLVLSSKV